MRIRRRGSSYLNVIFIVIASAVRVDIMCMVGAILANIHYRILKLYMRRN